MPADPLSTTNAVDVSDNAVEVSDGAGDDASSVARAAVLEVAAGLPLTPLRVEPQRAPSGSLSPQLAGLVADLRVSLETWRASNELSEDVKAEADSHMDDFTLARFITARDLKLPEAEEMFVTTMAYRAAKRLNAVRAELHPDAKHAEGTLEQLRHSTVRACFHAGFGGIAKDGSAFFVEHLGRLDVASIDRDPDIMALMEEAYAGHYLEPAFASGRLASARTGKMQRAVSIIDASGASLSLLSHMRVVKAVAKIGTSFYPDVLKKVYIVNAPWAAAAAWRMIAPILPAQTRQKVNLFASGFQEQLLEEIDASELPAFLGGTREAPNAVPRAEKLPPGVGDQLRALQSQAAPAPAAEQP